MGKYYWDSYLENLKNNALFSSLNDEDFTKLVRYADNLHSKQLPIIFDQNHLSLHVGYNLEFLRKISNAQHKFYRTFSIPKKSAGERRISEPLPSLKEIQRWILDNILSRRAISKFAKAYSRKKSIKSGAWYHVGRKQILTIDIEDFFGSLKYRNVLRMFSSFGYTKSISTLLAKLCTLNGSLPQGAPTSPAISNILMITMDKRISGFTSKNKIRYTRYADDMTFSGDFDSGMIIKFVSRVLSDYELKINAEKLRTRRPHQRQEVTGIVVNEKMQAPRGMRRKLRQSIYYIEKFGLPSHLDRTSNDRGNHIRHLLGIANFIKFVNPEDKEVSGYIEFLHDHQD